MMLNYPQKKRRILKDLLKIFTSLRESINDLEVVKVKRIKKNAKK